MKSVVLSDQSLHALDEERILTKNEIKKPVRSKFLIPYKKVNKQATKDHPRPEDTNDRNIIVIEKVMFLI